MHGVTTAGRDYIGSSFAYTDAQGTFCSTRPTKLYGTGQLYCSRTE